MNYNINNFKESIKTVENMLLINSKAMKLLDIDQSIVVQYQKIVDALPKLSQVIDEPGDKNIKTNYINLYNSFIDQIRSVLPFHGYSYELNIENQNEDWKNHYKEAYRQIRNNVADINERLSFSLDFFEKVGFFDKNIVAIGANGSGKTTLSSYFKSYINDKGVVISAQRILLIPNFSSISNPINTASSLKEYQMMDKSSRSENSFSRIQHEFQIVLTNLLAENISEGDKFRREAIRLAELKLDIPPPENTKLDIAIEIWNSLIGHRKISCDDGMNISATENDEEKYPAMQMSDGEKVMLYLIAHVLQAPNRGFIIVDEPEMYLHKTILKKLWNVLEAKRDDCIFIYLTHDLDFATSRTTAKKLWIKSFTYPDKWVIESIESEKIPEALLMELLGSRKNILFCEGETGSNDERVLNILFPHLTVTPLKSCFDVINHTKAFNKIENANTEALGIIDSDYHSEERLDKIKRDGIYNFKVAEIENLFLDEDFLRILQTETMAKDDAVERIKEDIFQQMNVEIDLQTSNYVSAKINNYFTDSDISKGNDLEQLNKNYNDFLIQIDIEKWYDDRKNELLKMIDDKDYNKIITSFNHKGLKRIANNRLSITDFTDRCIILLQKSKKAKEALLKYFPEKIKQAGIDVADCT